MIWKNTWLGRMWQTEKLMFVGVLIYLGGVAWFALHQREEFPFFLYGMYSLKEEPQPEYVNYEITAAGQQLQYTTLWDAQKELITSTLAKGLNAEQTGNLSPAQSQKLREWMFRYIADMRLIEDNTLKVDKLTCRYDSLGNPVVVERKTVIDYAAD